MSSDLEGGISNRQLIKDRKALVGALFSAGDKTGALALMRGKITTEQALERLR